MSNSLKNKRVVVTGSSSGIGAGIAKHLANLGARVLIHYCHKKENAQQVASGIREMGTEALIFQANLRSARAIEKMFLFIDEQWNGLDILVNNAGIVFKGSALDADARYWDNTLNLNLRAPYLTSREAAGRMLSQENGGSIVNISSIYGERCPEYFSAYSASKAGLNAMTRVLAIEWGPKIRVNAVAPGIVPVERTKDLFENALPEWEPYLPLKRFGKVEDIAALVEFLCSDKASWITGHVYKCDGGMLLRGNAPQKPEPPLPEPPPPIKK